MSAAPVITRPATEADRADTHGRARAGRDDRHEVLVDGCVLSRSGVAPVIALRPRRREAQAAMAPARSRTTAPVARRAGSRGARYAPASRPAGIAPATPTLSRRAVLIVRRLTVATAAAAALAVIVALGAAVVDLTGSPAGADRGRQAVVVQPGETLWDVAAASGAGGDVRDTMEQIRRLNHLDGSGLEAGQRLVVPAAR